MTRKYFFSFMISVSLSDTGSTRKSYIKFWAFKYGYNFLVIYLEPPPPISQDHGLYTTLFLTYLNYISSSSLIPQPQKQISFYFGCFEPSIPRSEHWHVYVTDITGFIMFNSLSFVLKLCLDPKQKGIHSIAVVDIPVSLVAQMNN